jgi:hypothetical protein
MVGTELDIVVLWRVECVCVCAFSIYSKDGMLLDTSKTGVYCNKLAKC